MKLNLFRLMMAVALSAGLAAADTMTSVSCATPTAALQTGTSSCDAPGSYGYSQATVRSNVLLPSTASEAAVIKAVTSASAMQFGTHGIAGTATAQSMADIGIIFDTAGAARSGLLELNFTQNAWAAPVNGFISESLSVGSYRVTPGGSNFSIWIPIQLGGEFGFDYAQSLTAIGSAGSGVTSGNVDAAITLQAFEADGVTGVQLFDPPGSPAPLLATPEPGGLGLMTMAIAGGLLFLMRSRR